MRALRTTLRVFGILSAVLVCLLVVFVLVSQTAWFRDWLRRYAMREAAQFVNGQLVIGRIDGGLWGGVQLHDVRITRDGATIVGLDRLDLDYSLLDFVREGVVINRVEIAAPVVNLRREGDTWNVATLIAEQPPSDPDAPRAAFRVESIVLRDGLVTVTDPTCPAGEPGCLPERLDQMRLDARVVSTAEALELALRDASLRTSEPALALRQLTTTLRMTDTDIAVRDLVLETAASTLRGSAEVNDYADTPTIDASLAAAPLALPEVARFVPQLGPTTLTPSLDLRAQGRLDALRVQLDTRSDGGRLQADLVADGTAPSYGAKGTASVERLDLAQWLGDPAQATNLSATTTVDVTGSDLATLAGTVALEASRLEAQGYAAERLAARARLDGGVADLTADGRAYDTDLEARGTIRYAGAPGDAVALDLRGAIGGLDVRKLPASLGAPALGTDVSLDYQVSGTPDRLRMVATFARSTVDTLVIAAGTTATVTVNGPAIGYAIDGAVQDVDVQRLGRVLEIAALDAPMYASDLDAAVQLSGRGTSAETAVATAQVRITESSFAGARIPSLTIDAAADRGAVDLQVAGRIVDLDPAVASGRSDLAGRVSGRVDLAASIPDIGVEIDPTQIDLRADVTLDPSDVGGVTLEAMRLDARLADGVGEVTALRVVSPILEVDASGPVALVEGGTSRLTYDVRVKDAGAVADLAGVPGVAGTATVQGTLTGWLDRLAVDGTLSAEDVVYAETGSVERLAGSYQVTLPDRDASKIDATVKAEAAVVEAGGTQLDAVTLAARYADRAATFDVDLSQGDLRAGAAGQAQLGDDAQTVTLRRLDARGGGLAWALADGASPRIVLETGRVNINDLRLASGPERLSVEGAVRLPAEGTPLSAEALEVQATAIDLEPIGRQFAPDQGLRGTLEARVTFDGPLDTGVGTGAVTVRNGVVQGFAFEALTADANIADGAAQIDATLRQDAASTLTAVGRVPLPATTAAAAEGASTATPARDSRLDLTIGGTGIDLAVLGAVTDQVSDVRGRLLVDARVTGTIAQPAVNGTVQIRDGGFGVPLVQASYEGLQADVRITPDLVQVNEFRLLDGDGNALDVTGTLGVADATVGDVQLTAKAKEFRLLDNDLGDLRLTADLGVTGTPSAPIVRGTITIPSSLVSVDRLLAALEGREIDSLPDDVDFIYTPAGGTVVANGTEGGRIAPVAPSQPATGVGPLTAAAPAFAPDGTAPVTPATDAEAAPAADPFEAATLDVALIIPDDLVLRGDDVRVGDGPSLGAMNLTVGADLKATSRPGEPLLVTGEIVTIRGYYEFQGRRFTVVRDGAIRFDGADITDPTLALSATRDISGVEARIDVRGTAQEPRLELSSTPPLDEADVLALIVFNRPLDDLGSGEQVSLAQQAGELIGGRLTGGLATSLRDALGVDQFEIDAFAASGPNVTLGNRIGERIYIRIRQQLGAQDVSQILLEYELLGNLRLQTSVTPAGNTDRSPGQRIERNGIDLLYFFYY